MPELSNLIRQRLGAAKAPASHPDADLIGAYGEDGLQPEERADLTAHLAACVHCRELLALSLPEQAVAAAAIALKPKNRYLGSYLRVAASLAMVIVAVLLLLRRPHHEPAVRTELAQSDGARSSQPRAPNEMNEVAPSAVVSAPPASTAGKEAPETKSLSRRAAKVRDPEAQQKADMAEIRSSSQTVEVASAAVSEDYVNSQALANQLLLADQAQQRLAARELPSAPSPVFNRAQKNMFMAGGVVAGNSFAGIPPGSAQQNIQSLSTVSIFHDSSHRGLSITSTIARVGSELRLKRPLAQITSQNANRYAMFKPAPGGSAGAEIASTAETSENLKQSPAFTAPAMAAPLRTQSPMFFWKIVQGKLLKSSDMSNWREGYSAGEGIDFSIVRSVGPEVWAGGSNAALVHSSDSGLSWQRVVLGAAATGVITSIEISGNGQNIQVTSSSGQSWASQDGGKSWMMVN